MSDETQKKPSPSDEQRSHPRIETHNFVSYVCLDEDGNEIAEGYGTTRDLSQGGVKLETREPVESPFILLLAIDLNQQLLEIYGNVVYSKQIENDRFFTGIRFIDTQEKQRKIVLNFVKSHVYLRKRDEEID